MDENNQVSKQETEIESPKENISPEEKKQTGENPVQQPQTEQPKAQAEQAAPQQHQPEQPKAQTEQTSSQQPQPVSEKKESVDKGDLWYVDNYILLRDYYDRTISRIAARCVRMGNIAIEEYPQYSYILDVLQEISETGNFIIQHEDLYPFVERKIKGGIAALRKNLAEYEDELQKNSSPDMIKEDKGELSKMKDALGGIVTDDPTKGAGMNMDDLMDKLMKQSNIDTGEYDNYDANVTTPDIKPGPKQF